MEKLEKLKHSAAVRLSRAADLFLITLLDEIGMHEKSNLNFLSLATLIECKMDGDSDADEIDLSLQKELPAILQREVVKRWRAIKENKQVIPGEISEIIS